MGNTAEHPGDDVLVLKGPGIFPHGPLLEPGVNRHFEPGEFDQFQPKKNSQQSSAIVSYSKRWSILSHRNITM